MSLGTCLMWGEAAMIQWQLICVFTEILHPDLTSDFFSCFKIG